VQIPPSDLESCPSILRRTHVNMSSAPAHKFSTCLQSELPRCDAEWRLQELFKNGDCNHCLKSTVHPTHLVCRRRLTSSLVSKFPVGRVCASIKQSLLLWCEAAILLQNLCIPAPQAAF